MSICGDGGEYNVLPIASLEFLGRHPWDDYVRVGSRVRAPVENLPTIKGKGQACCKRVDRSRSPICRPVPFQPLVTVPELVDRDLPFAGAVPTVLSHHRWSTV